MYLRLFEARELWDAGALAEVTAYVRNHKELAPSAYFASANDYRTAGGKLFALPNYVNAEMIWVNSRLLGEAGLHPRASDVKTWDDLARYNQTLSKRAGDGKYVQLGHPMNAVAWQGLSAYVYANGGEVQDAEVTKATLNTPQMERVLVFWREQYARHGNPALWEESLRQPGVDNFQTERWAIRDRSFGFARASRATPNYFPSGTDSWLIPVPLGPTAKGPANTMWVNQMGVPKGVPHPDLAFELLRCAVDVKGQTVMHQLAQWEPSMPAYYQSQAFRDELKKDPLLQVGTGRLQDRQDLPLLPALQRGHGRALRPLAGGDQGGAGRAGGPDGGGAPAQPGPADVALQETLPVRTPISLAARFLRSPQGSDSRATSPAWGSRQMARSLVAVGIALLLLVGSVTTGRGQRGVVRVRSPRPDHHPRRPPRAGVRPHRVSRPRAPPLGDGLAVRLRRPAPRGGGEGHPGEAGGARPAHPP